MRTERDPTLLVLVLLSVVSAVAFGWLFTLDVHVVEEGVDGGPAFCGSAYDVALLERDGYLGGEIPSNQGEIDRACVAQARRYVAWSGLAAGTALALGLGALWQRRRAAAVAA